MGKQVYIISDNIYIYISKDIHVASITRNLWDNKDENNKSDNNAYAKTY